MLNYLRYRVAGRCYFFTVNLLERKQHLLTDHIDLLRYAFRKVKQQRPFHIDAIVILPEHLHCILTLPENDTDFSGRWQQIKKHFPNNCLLLNIDLKYIFHRFVEKGVYSSNWGTSVDLSYEFDK